MDDLVLSRISQEKWIGKLRGKVFGMTVDNDGVEFTLEFGNITTDEWEEVCVRFYHDDYEYIEI